MQQGIPFTTTTLQPCGSQTKNHIPDSYWDVKNRIMRMKRTLICERCNEKMEIINKARRFLDRSAMDEISGAGEGDYTTVLHDEVSDTFEITEITYKCPRCSAMVYEWR